MLDSQMSRYGAIAKALPLMNPGAKVFFLGPSSASWFGDFVNTFPPDGQGGVRVHSTITAVQDNAELTASRGDVVLALPGYTETLTAVKSLTTAGVQWIGVGEGLLKPTITVNAATHGIALGANNIVFENFHFAAPGTDAALSMIHIDDDCTGVTVRKITGVGSDATNNFVHCIAIGNRANDHRLEDIRLTTDKTLAVTAFLSFEGPVSRSTIGGFWAVGSVATAGVIDASGARIKNAMWDRMYIAVGGVTKPALTIDAGSAANGMVTNSFFAGTHGTIASNAAFTGDWRLSQVYVSEETGNVAQGALIPAVDAD